MRLGMAAIADSTSSLFYGQFAGLDITQTLIPDLPYRHAGVGLVPGAFQIGTDSDRSAIPPGDVAPTGIVYLATLPLGGELLPSPA